MHIRQQAIRVAVDPQGSDLLEMTGLLAFEPKLAAAAAKIVHQAGCQRFLERLFVGIGLHQDFPVFGPSGDDRHQAAVVLFQLGPDCRGNRRVVQAGSGRKRPGEAGQRFEFGRRQPDRDFPKRQVTLELRDRDFAEMKQAGCQDRFRAALRQVSGDGDELDDEHARLHRLATPTSLDRVVGDEDGSELIDLLADDAPGPEDLAMAAEEDRLVTGLLDVLDGRARFAVEQRFGLHDGRKRSYREVGEELGVTAEAARRMVKRAVITVRNEAVARSDAA